MADGRRWPLRGLSAQRLRCLAPRAARNRCIMASRKGARSLRPRAVDDLKLGGRQAHRAKSGLRRSAPRQQTSGARLPTFEPTCPNPNIRRACHFFSADARSARWGWGHQALTKSACWACPAGQVSDTYLHRPATAVQVCYHGTLNLDIRSIVVVRVLH